MSDELDRLSRALADRYTIERELGRGGMSTVYLAEDTKLRRRVALKVLRPELATALGPDRFLREIEISANLHHPHIVPLHDSGEADGLLYYVMPHVEGESLRDRLNREQQLPLADALQIAREVADALGYAHERGVIHRDIKPENILLDRNHASVADFGIARALDQAGTERLTETGYSLGTPHYMSPEQGTGDTNLTDRADIYSLACVLYEMLAGEPPFTGPSAGAILAKHATGTRPSVRVVRDTVPAALDAVIMKGMARLPTDRFASAMEFARAIAEAGAETSIRRRRHALAIVWAAASAVVVFGLATTWGRLTRTPETALAPDRIMVFPLVVSEGFPGSRSIGEDIATMIGSALDGTGPLRWIDGWTQLDPSQRQNIRDLSEGEARAIARAQRCGYYVSGRVLARDDSTAQIFLSLHDVRDGTERRRSEAAVPLAEAWKGVRAVNALLPELVTGRAPERVSELESRPPTAIASFLLGEAAFRRLRMGEAREHFQAAVAADSSFALAALRGAQAASWDHRSEDAAELVQVAGRQPLPRRYAAFARGYQAYLEGRADSALAGFRSAIALDRDMIESWIQLGETWTHLLAEAGDPDDSALVAFQQAIQLDSTAVSTLFHVLQILLRRGDTVQVAPLIERFLGAEPEAGYVDQIRIMDGCVRFGPAQVRWDSLARAAPLAVLLASKNFAAGGARLACAEAGFDALLRNDTTAAPEAENRRFWEIFGLQNILLAQGREDELLTRVTEFVDRWGAGSTLFLLDAPYYPRLADDADEVARADAAAHGRNYERLQFSTRLWDLGLFEAKRGNLAVAQAVGDALAKGDRSGGAERGRQLAKSVEAHIALARGDSSRALALLDVLVPPVAPGDASSWDEALSGGADRLDYARLLAWRGDYRRAIDVANVLDSPWPFSYPLYLVPSLRVRLDAAIALGDSRLVSRFRARLDALRPEGTPR